MAKGTSSLQMLSNLYFFNEYINTNTKAMFYSSEFQTILNSRQNFDAIIMGNAQSIALIGLTDFFDAPLIVTSSSKFSCFLESLTGAYAHDSFISNFFMNFGDEMTFSQRFTNVLVNGFNRLMSKGMMTVQVSF